MANYRFKEFRDEAKLTQDELAAGAELSISQISRFESGDREPRVGELLRIAKLLNVPWTEIIEQGASTRVRVPLVSWVSAGKLEPADSVLSLDADKHIPAVDLGPGEWMALKVEGDSMDRISPPGSIIFINRKDRKLVPNACYVIADEAGDATYKRFRPGPNRFEPVSVNTAHEAIYPQGKVNVIGRVRKSILDM